MPTLEQSFRLAIRAAEEGDPDFRVTLEATSDPAKWVQLSWDTINAAYPLAEPPSDTLVALSIVLPEYVEITEWEAGQFVTFEHGAEPLADLVRFVHEYLARVLHIPADDTALRLVDESR